MNGGRAVEYQILEDKIAAVIARGGPRDDEEFGELALEVHCFQRQRNEPVDRYCRSISGEQAPADWRAIPPVPQAAFKRFDLRAFPAAETVRTFHTSGTTGEGAGRHHFRSLRLYEASIRTGWTHFKLPCHLPQFVLTLKPADAPHSSLSHMMGVLGELASQQTFCLRADGALDLATLDRLENTREPVLLLGTALAFLHWFEELSRRGARLSLPVGSCALETGGYKGSERTLNKDALYAQFQAYLGLNPDAIVNEYGMTELSTPFYTRGLGDPHEGPPWARALVIDPETGAEADIDAVGVVRLFDLANLGSSLAIGTQDLAIARGPSRFELLGRDPAALPRGCSRAADELLSR